MKEKAMPPRPSELPLVEPQDIQHALRYLPRILDSPNLDRVPLFAWLSQFHPAYLAGGVLCSYAHHRARARGGILHPITPETLANFEVVLQTRQKQFLTTEGTIDDAENLVANFATWKPENPDLMDYLAVGLPRQLRLAHYSPGEIALVQAGALQTYEFYRMEAAKPH